MRKLAIATAAVAALLPALTACGPGPAPARVVRIDSGVADTVGVLSFPDHWSGQVEGGHPAAWLGPGRFLIGSLNALLPYQKDDGEHLQLGFNDWSARLAGRVVSLDLSKDSAFAWLAHASETDLAGLRLVSLRDSLPSTLRPALKRLAAANPHVGLTIDIQAAVNEILALFRPRVLMLPELDSSASRQLTPQRQIETLITSSGDSGSLDVLRLLPNLRQLLLDNTTVDRAGQLPAGLEALTVTDGTVDLNRLGSLPRLRTLVLTGSEWRGVSGLAALPKLQWLGFPTNATQAEFAAIVRAHSDLEVVELIGVDSVTDLAPLRSARHLRALTIDGRYRDLGVLRDLPSLEFVGLSKQIWTDAPDQVAAIRAALPAAAVVKVTPLCLGSGWILLLVPVALLVMLAGRRTRRAWPIPH